MNSPLLFFTMSLIQKDKIILRLTNLPTLKGSNAGRQPAFLSMLNGFRTIYITDVNRGEVDFKYIHNSKVLYADFKKILLTSSVLIKLAFKNKVDIVAIHNYKFIPVSFVLRMLNFKIVYHIHGLDKKLFENSILGFFLGIIYNRIFSVCPLPQKKK